MTILTRVVIESQTSGGEGRIIPMGRERIFNYFALTDKLVKQVNDRFLLSPDMQSGQ